MLIHLNEDVNTKRYKAKRFYLPKCIIKNYNVIIKKNNFYDKPTDSDVKRYEQIKKLKIMLQYVHWIMITLKGIID